MIRVVAFDFDGVLVDSVEVKGEAFACLFEQHGPEVVRRVLEHHLSNGGMSRFEKFRHYYRDFLGQSLDDQQLSALCQRFAEIAVQRVRAAPLVAGALECLAHCRRAGYLMYVVSATPQEEVRQLAADRALAEFFEDIFGSPASKAELLERVLTLEGLNPEELLYVGDAAADYDAARQLGLPFVARATGQPDWAALGIDHFPDLTRLPEYLERHSRALTARNRM